MPRKRMSLLGELSVLLLSLFALLAAQDYNPSYPRTAFVSPASGEGGTPHLFMAQYDLIASVKRGDEVVALNDSIRRLNPNTIIMGTSQQGAWPGSAPPELFAFHATFLTTTATISPGADRVNFKFENEYAIPTKHKFALIGGDDWIQYQGYDANGFYGIPTSGTFAVSRTHAAGDSIRFPIRMGGFGMIPNFTDFAPRSEGKESWRWFVDERFRRQDFRIFDAVSYDAFRMRFWGDDFETASGVDFDYNRKDDLQEFGINWLNARWAEGIKKLLDYEHQQFKALNPGKPALIQINTGAVEDGYPLDYCEGMVWEGYMRFATDWISMLNVNRKWDKKMQERGLLNLTLITDYERESRAEYGKNVFNRMRYGLTTALLSGCFYGRTFGDYYYITYYHDEFDTDLGYPTSEPMELKASGAWVRFFTKGAAICNPMARDIVVNAGELTGLPGYDGPYYRLRGGQDPAFNNGEQFQSVQLKGEERKPAKYSQGDGILLFKVPTTVVADIYIGNTFNNDTSPGNNPVELEGAWQEVQDPAGSLPFQSRMRCFSQWNQREFNGSTINDGIGYAYAAAGNGSAKARFRPVIGVAGYYDVQEWHGDAPSNEGTNVPYEIVVEGQVKVRGQLNQRTDGGKWNFLGRVYLPKGENSYVLMTNQADGYVLADAVRFRFLGENLTPDDNPPAAPQNLRIMGQ